MLKAEVVIPFVFLTRLYEFFEGGNEPVFMGREFSQRIERKATIRGELPALAVLQILDVGESGVLQLFC